MTDGVARELEQAEARLERARQRTLADAWYERHDQFQIKLSQHVSTFEAAAIEVGRLRAIAALDEAINEEHETWHATIFQKGRAPLAPPIAECRNLVCRARAALAAREEVEP